MIPNGILDLTEPVRRNDALDLLEFSGNNFQTAEEATSSMLHHIIFIAL